MRGGALGVITNTNTNSDSNTNTNANANTNTDPDSYACSGHADTAFGYPGIDGAGRCGALPVAAKTKNLTQMDADEHG